MPIRTIAVADSADALHFVRGTAIQLNLHGILGGKVREWFIDLVGSVTGPVLPSFFKSTIRLAPLPSFVFLIIFFRVLSILRVFWTISFSSRLLLIAKDGPRSCKAPCPTPVPSKQASSRTHDHHGSHAFRTTYDTSSAIRYSPPIGTRLFPRLLVEEHTKTKATNPQTPRLSLNNIPIQSACQRSFPAQHNHGYPRTTLRRQTFHTRHPHALKSRLMCSLRPHILPRHQEAPRKSLRRAKACSSHRHCIRTPTPLVFRKWLTNRPSSTPTPSRLLNTPISAIPRRHRTCSRKPRPGNNARGRPVPQIGDGDNAPHSWALRVVYVSCQDCYLQPSWRHVCIFFYTNPTSRHGNSHLFPSSRSPALTPPTSNVHRNKSPVLSADPVRIRS